MAQSHNRVELIGRLGGDPELRHTGEGTPVASFRLASRLDIHEAGRDQFVVAPHRAIEEH